MAAPNMAAITASLERSFQNFSLNPLPSSSSAPDSALEHSPTTDESPVNGEDDSINNRLFIPNPPDDTVLELNSHVSLPYHWEQCLDLVTGEIYYINWRNGMRSSEDPRLWTTGYDGECYSSEESCYDSAESSSDSPPSSSRESRTRTEKDHVLVVAGCKSCLMYFMVPKRVEDCPKCTGQLIHFDRALIDGGSP